MPVDILLIADECRELYDMQSEGEKATRQSFSPRRERSGRMWTPFSNISQGNISVCVGAASAKEKNRTFSDTQEGNGRIIGFYSPVRRLGQTKMALRKGRELSRTENVLYLNMESYAGPGVYFPEERQRNMSELLYYAKQESKSWPVSLRGW